MTDQELRVLATLVSVQVVNGKIYVPKPEIPGDLACAGCAFADNGHVPKPGTKKRAGCDHFLVCRHVIHVELKHE